MRNYTAFAHRIIGVIVGVFIIIIGLTGSVLVFDKQVNPILHLATHQVIPQGEKISLQTATSIIYQQYPEAQLEWITIPTQITEPYHLLIKSKGNGKTDIYLNPYSGEVLGIYLKDSPFFKIINQLHTHLLAGKIGSFLVGVCGVLLLILSITGVMLWNGWKKFSVGWKIRWQAKAKILQYDLHKVGGVVVAIFLVLIAASGSFMVFHKPLENLSYLLTGNTKIEKPISQISTNVIPLTLDDFLKTALDVLPEGKPTVLYPAKDAKSTVRVRFKLPDEIAPEGKSFVYLNQYQGDVLQIERFFETSIFEQIKPWMDALHTGSYGGLIMLFFYIIVGIISAGLSITGFVIWWGRSGNKPKKKVA
jgi:uncharacterized iron-regulated membrane protein